MTELLKTLSKERFENFQKITITVETIERILESINSDVFFIVKKI